MKDERIITSWNKIVISDEVNRRTLNHIYDELAEEKKISIIQRQWSRSVALVLVAIAVILMGGTTVAVAYNCLTSNGKLTLFKANKESDMNTDVIFTLDAVAKVKNDEITGDIIECEKLIADQVKNADMFSSQSPFAVEKNFESIDIALDYIGYKGLHWPKLDTKIDEITVTAISEIEDTIQEIRLKSNYTWSEELSAVSEAIIFTESFDGEIGTGITSYSDWFMGVDFSTETIDENGREFLIACSTEFENGYLVKCVFWQENSVVYSFSLRYKEVDEKQVNTIVANWMAGF